MYFENFDSDTKRLLEEKNKVLRCVVEKVPFFRDIDGFRTEVADYHKDTLRACTLVEATKPNFNECQS